MIGIENKILNGYYNFLIDDNYSPSTIEVYLSNVKQELTIWASKRGFSSEYFNKLSKKDVQLLLGSLSNFKGSGSFSAFLKQKIEIKKEDNSRELNEPLNQILFGPPGTGKTYHLNILKQNFTDTASGISESEVMKEIAEGNPWWKLIAALLYIRGDMKVPELTQEPIIKSKHNSDKPTKANQIIWSQLQLHTKPDNPHVNHVRRHDPAIFWKDQDSNWSVDKELVEKELVDIVALAEEIKNLGNRVGTTKEVYRYDFITFHQSFTYEDFLEGIKPVLEDNGLEEKENQEIGYQIEKGIFYRSCLKALNYAGYKSFTECYSDSLENRRNNFLKSKSHALFIDEINRGNVSSIFGELITLIEKDKRLGQSQEIWVNLPYDKNIKFGVPPNLYIVGTMNTADRSVEALDTALRRRFAFKEVAPNPELLRSSNLLWELWKQDYDLLWEDKKWIAHETSLLKILGGEKVDEKAYRALEKIEWDANLEKDVFQGIVTFSGINFKRLLEEINERIALLLDKDHMIGHAYFLSLVGAEDGEQELLHIFYNKIIPLLEEYFYGDYGKIGLILGEDFVEPKDGAHVKFANFSHEDEAIFKDKKLYTIIDYRSSRRSEFLKAVKNIYAIDEPVIADAEGS
ncbi:MAG: AAA family ATPase [Fulvivirga sp.]